MTKLPLFIAVAFATAAFAACSGSEEPVTLPTGGGDASTGGEDTGTILPEEDAGQSSDTGGGGNTDAPVAVDSGPADAGPKLSFFATSTGSGAAGGNLGGLTGADTKCQTLGAAAGAGARTWHAYLSTNTNNGGTLVNAKDRIGAGPWYNQKGELIANNLTDLHAADIPAAMVLDEKGALVPKANPNRHDILTGSNVDGTATMLNCRNWATNQGTATVGHSDSSTTANSATDRWNNAHATPGCTQANLNQVGGEGRFYCFAL